MHNLQILQTRTTFKRRSRYSPTSSQGRVLVEQASVMAYLTRLSVDFFSYNLLNARKQKNYYRQATYKDNFSAFPQPSAMFLLQKINRFNAIVTMRSTHNESLDMSQRDSNHKNVSKPSWCGARLRGSKSNALTSS